MTKFYKSLCPYLSHTGKDVKQLTRGESEAAFKLWVAYNYSLKEPLLACPIDSCGIKYENRDLLLKHICQDCPKFKTGKYFCPVHRKYENFWQSQDQDRHKRLDTPQSSCQIAATKAKRPVYDVFKRFGRHKSHNKIATSTSPASLHSSEKPVVPSDLDVEEYPSPTPRPSGAARSIESIAESILKTRQKCLLLTVAFPGSDLLTYEIQAPVHSSNQGGTGLESAPSSCFNSPVGTSPTEQIFGLGHKVELRDRRFTVGLEPLTSCWRAD